MDFKKHLKHVFGAYVEAQYDPTVSNAIFTRMYTCIALEK